MTRLCRIGPASRVQLRFLSTSNDTHIYHLRRLQRLASILVCTILWIIVFRHRELHIQVSATLRHGP